MKRAVVSACIGTDRRPKSSLAKITSPWAENTRTAASCRVAAAYWMPAASPGSLRELRLELDGVGPQLVVGRAMRAEVLHPYERAPDHQHEGEHQPGELQGDPVAEAAEHAALGGDEIAGAGNGAYQVFAQLAA